MAIIIGSSGDDVLFGTVLNDSISSLEGNDFIDAGDGDDEINPGTGSGNFIDGGDGIDTLNFAGLYPGDVAVSDRIIVLGADEVAFTPSGDFFTFTNIETVIGTDVEAARIADIFNLGGSFTTVYTGLGTDSIRVSSNAEFINTGVGSGDIIRGVAADYDGDTFEAYKSGDTIGLLGAVFTESDMTLTLGSGSAVLEIDTDQDGDTDVTINFIGDYSNGEFEVNIVGPSSFVHWKPYANEFIVGGEGFDIQRGGYGDDTYLGGGGNDSLSGFEGDDLLDGGTGSDTLFGERGNDILLGGDGDDFINPGQGHDYVDGGDGDDFIFLTPGSNSEQALDGPAMVIADAGVIVAGPGNITHFENVENFAGTLFDDTFIGGAEDWYYVGEAGDDTFRSGGGDETFNGGAGADTFIYSRNDGSDTVEDFEIGIDTFVVKGNVSVSNWYEDDVDNDGVLDTVFSMSNGETLTFLSISGITDSGDIFG